MHPDGAGNRPSPARPKVFSSALSENSPTSSGFRLCRPNQASMAPRNGLLRTGSRTGAPFNCRGKSAA
jgi:hypothetical protein